MKTTAKILSAVLSAGLMCAVFSACNTDELLDMSEYSRIREENSVYQESQFSSYMIIENSRKAESSKEESKRKASEREASKKEASRLASEREISRQEYLKKLEEEKTEEQHLRDYADLMVTSGRGTIPKSKQTYFWKVNKFSIDDFNNDGSPELVIQYYIGTNLKVPERGVALEIIKYKNKQFYSFKKTKEMSDYINTEWTASVNHEICDELYVDAEKKLGILSTHIYGDPSMTVVYDTYSVKNDRVSHEESLYLSVEKYPGKFNVSNPNKCGFAICGKDFLVYRFFTNPEHIIRYDKDTGRAHQKQILELKKEKIFAIPDALVHKLEKTAHYDTTKITFCALDEIEDAYQKAKESSSPGTSVQAAQ